MKIEKTDLWVTQEIFKNSKIEFKSILDEKKEANITSSLAFKVIEGSYKRMIEIWSSQEKHIIISKNKDMFFIAVIKDCEQSMAIKYFLNKNKKVYYTSGIIHTNKTSTLWKYLKNRLRDKPNVLIFQMEK